MMKDTDGRRAGRARASGERTYRAMFDSSPMAIVRIAPDGTLAQVNAACCRLLAATEAELLHVPAASVVHPGDAAAERAAGERLRADRTAVVKWEKRLRLTSGRHVWVAATAAVIGDCVVQYLEDITERRRQELLLRFQVDHDPLTGVCNRRRFEAELHRHLERGHRYGPSGALMIIDLDHFKAINDNLGHAAGDGLICAAAQLLRDRVRATDALARLGGDEFGVLMADGGQREAETLAASLVEKVRSRFLAQQVTASIGCALFDAPSARQEEMLARADEALYRAKTGGRDRYALATSSALAPPSTTPHPDTADLR